MSPSPPEASVMSDAARQKKLLAAKKKLRKFQESKSPQAEKVPDLKSNADTIQAQLPSTHAKKDLSLELVSPDNSFSTKTQVDASVYFSPISSTSDSNVSSPASTTSHLSPASIDDRMSPTLPAEGETDLTEVEAANLQQSLESYKRSNQVLVSQVNEQRKQLLLLQEKMKTNDMSGKVAQEQKALKEQLEIHIQTIGILVQEKSELQSNAATLQKKLQVKEAEISDLNDKLHVLRNRVVELEKMVTALQAGLDKETLLSKDVTQERDRLSSKLYEVSSEKDEVFLQNSELQEKLQSKINECSMLIDQINQFNSKLQKAEFMVQQLSANSADSISAENWQIERDLLIKTLEEHKLNVSKLVTEKAYLLEKQNDTQEHYDIKIEHLTNKISTLEGHESELLDTVNKLEETLSSLKENPPAPTPVIQEDTVKENDKQATVIANLTNERQTLESELDIQIKENRRLGRQVIELEDAVQEQKAQIQQYGEESQDKLTLLDQIQADKDTISRALQQNKLLKEQLEELQEGFIKVSNTSADLTTKLESEQHGNMDIASKLSDTQIELEEARLQLKNFNASSDEVQLEYTQILDECKMLQDKMIQKEMDVDLLSTQLEATKVDLNKQMGLNEELQKLVQQPDLSYKLHDELQSAQDTINTLTNQNILLNNTMAEMQEELELAKEKEREEADDAVDEAPSDIEYAKNVTEDEQLEIDCASPQPDIDIEERELHDAEEILMLQTNLQQLQDERMKIIQLLQDEREKSFNAVAQLEEHIELQVNQQLQQKQRELMEHYYQETEALQLKIKSLEQALEIMRKNEEIDEFDVGSSDISMPVLKTAFMQLQKRYKQQMDLQATLNESIEELEHKNSQLELETETIGEYITLYQSQRQALKDRFAERDQVIAKLSNEHGRMQVKVTQLHQLVMQLLSERSGVQMKNKQLQELVNRRLALQSGEESKSEVPKLDYQLDALFGEVTLTADEENELVEDNVNVEKLDTDGDIASDHTTQQIMQIFEQLETTGEGYQHGWLSPAARKHHFAPCSNCSERVINI